MNRSSAALYIHVPFCTKICPYCDFYKTIWKEDDENRFVDALIREWKNYEPFDIRSVFVGGGTPSALSAKAMEQIFSAINPPSDVEFTVEVNPESATIEKLALFKQLGVNRISIGVQSFIPAELAFLGRQHTPQGIAEAIDRVRGAGFSNFNLDLIYALPISTEDNLNISLEKALSFAPTHISTYSLSIEEGTPFHRRGIEKCGDETDLALAHQIRKRLADAGFAHYEVSAFAKPGFESAHNLAYWRLENYVGLGPSAASFFGGKFYQNSRDIRAYVADPMPKRDGPSADAQDFLLCNLRLRQGFSIRDFNDRFGADFYSDFAKPLRKLAQMDLLSASEDRVAVTEKGLDVLNLVLAELA